MITSTGTKILLDGSEVRLVRDISLSLPLDGIVWAQVERFEPDDNMKVRIKWPRWWERLFGIKPTPILITEAFPVTRVQIDREQNVIELTQPEMGDK